MPVVPVSVARRAASVAFPVLISGALATVSTAGGQTAHHRDLADKLRNGPGASNHPVHVVPSAAVRIPEEWPLGMDGSITCVTCHSALPSLSGDGADPLLRDFEPAREAPIEFCMKCHTQSDSRSASGVHWMAVGEAHVPAGRAAQTSSRNMLDSRTRACLGCHDGVNARESGNTTPWNRGSTYVGDPQRSHPVGVRYPDRTPSDFSVRFIPVGLLPDEIQLPEGQVGCISCHNLYGGTRNLLSVPIEGSELCLTCHDLR